MPNRLTRTLRKVLYSAGIGYLVLLVCMFAFQRRILYQPFPGPTDPAEAGLPSYHLASFNSRDDLGIPFWYHEGATSTSPLVFYFHGNGGGLHAFAGPLQRLADQGYAVAAMEYRGYPGAPGKPTEVALIADANKLASDLIEKNPNRTVVIWGYSLGSGIATQLAATLSEDRVVILEAPFTSVLARSQEMYPYLPVRALLEDPYDSIGHIANIHAALLIINGTADMIIPSAHGKALFDRAARPKTRIIYRNANHFDLDAHGAYNAAFAYIAKHTTR